MKNAFLDSLGIFLFVNLGVSIQHMNSFLVKNQFEKVCLEFCLKAQIIGIWGLFRRGIRQGKG